MRLCEYARSLADPETPQLIKAWTQMGNTKKLEQLPTLPRELNYLWGWFIQLFQNDGINYSSIRNFVHIRDLKLKQWEIDALFQLNDTVKAVHHDNAS